MTSVAPRFEDGDNATSPEMDDELRDALAAFVSQISGEGSQPGQENETFDDQGDEVLPPPELPAEYLATDRQSLSESDAYSAHLSEHWGF